MDFQANTLVSAATRMARIMEHDHGTDHGTWRNERGGIIRMATQSSYSIQLPGAVMFRAFNKTRFLLSTIARLTSGILAIQLTVLPVSFALKLQIDQDIKLRINQDGQQERVGLLKRGTIIEIPSEFVVSKNGEKNLELTLNNWLRKAGHKPPQSESGPGLFNFDGEKQDYFFPVTIAPGGLAPGSTIPKEISGQPMYLALGHLVKRGNALILTDDATVHPITPRQRAESSPEAVQARHARQQQMEASSPCAQGLCSKPSDTSESVKHLIRAISPALSAAETRSKRVFRRTKNDLTHIDSNFKKSCGFSLAEYTSLVRSRAEQAGVPTEILLSIMTQESSGLCYARNSETDSTQSIGLFQINSTNKRYPRCTTQQKNILKSYGTTARLATGPRCLENPLLNLEEAIRLLKEKRTAILRGGFDQSKIENQDLWRLVVSAYNGGEKWVVEAKKDLDHFNSVHGTHLDAHKWEDLRLFYFRSWLDPARRLAMVGKPNAGRSQLNSVANLSYAENIVGRSVHQDSRPGLTAQWIARVN